MKGPVGRASGSLLAVITLLASLVVVAAPVSAAAPTNDDRDAATVVDTLPYSDATDTSEATWQETDPNCDFSGEGDHTVWYSFTPTEARRFLVRTEGSDYDTTLTVTARTGDGLDIIRCNDDSGSGGSSAAVWWAAAGQEYLIMVGGCCPGETGHLEFAITVAPHRPTVGLKVAPTARLTRLGAVAVRGIVGCQNARRAHVSVSVRQDQGLRIVRGERTRTKPCGEPWTMRIANWDFRFDHRDILVVARASAWNASGYASRTVRRTMEVR